MANDISPKTDQKMKSFIDGLMKQMTLDEKIGQLNLVANPGSVITGAAVNRNTDKKIRQGLVGGMINEWTPERLHDIQKIAVEKSRLHIPLLFGEDVIHGHKTVFPIPLGLSCTWDMDLIKKTAHIAATEAAADGVKWVFSPMVDIARDPRWGRIAEGAGEDPHLGGRIAEAMVKGYQGDDLSNVDTVMACVKHFALYGAAEGGREYNTVDMSEQKMRETYLPPFEAAIKAGAGSLMPAFNDVNGVPATMHKKLLTDILRKEWGFDGFVVTDYTAINEMIAHGVGDLKTVSALALKAGVDMDMVGEGFVTTLKQSLAEKKVTQQEIDQACRRILEAKYKLGLFDNPYKFFDKQRAAREIMSPQNRQAAREAAARSCVLLKNKSNVLPLKKTGTIALIGPLAADKKNMLGTWAWAGDPEKAIPVSEGIKNVAGNGLNVLYAKGANITDDAKLADKANFFDKTATIDSRTPAQMIAEAVAVAKKSDVIVAVVGEARDMSGECSSRTDISIPESQRKLLQALAATGKPLVLVVMGGRPLTLEWENEHASSIVMSWFGGTEAGNGIADVLFGDYNPAGKLTTSFPRNVGQIPVYHAHKSTGRPAPSAVFKKFTSAYIDAPNEPLYPFGYGLSYTNFSYSPVKLDKTALKGDETLKASVTLTNTGSRAGEEVVQLYISDPVASCTRPVKELKGFQKVFLKPGEKKEITFEITPEDLKFYNTDLVRDWEAGDFNFHIGSSSADTRAATAHWEHPPAAAPNQAPITQSMHGKTPPKRKSGQKKTL
jgi:beta-glucosidase